MLDSMAHVPTETEQTARQLERCATLHIELAERHRELRRECERERWATRRIEARLDLIERHHH